MLLLTYFNDDQTNILLVVGMVVRTNAKATQYDFLIHTTYDDIADAATGSNIVSLLQALQQEHHNQNVIRRRWV